MELAVRIEGSWRLRGGRKGSRREKETHLGGDSLLGLLLSRVIGNSMVFERPARETHLDHSPVVAIDSEVSCGDGLLER
jgi:hypothetical protein